MFLILQESKVMKTSLLLVLLWTTVSAVSQTIVPGDKTQSLEDDQYIQDVLGSTEEAIWFSVSNGSGMVTGVGRVGHNGQEMEIKSFDAPLKTENVFWSSNDSHLSVFTNELEGDVFQCKLEVFDDWMASSGKKVIASHDVQSHRFTGHFKFSESPSGDLIGILQEAPYPKGEPEHFQIYVFKPDGEQLWYKEHKTSFAQNTRPANQITVSDQGDVHLIKRTRSGSDYTFHLFSFQNGGGSVKPQKIDLRGPKIVDVSLACNAEHKLIVSGFYTTGSYDHSNGYFFRTYTPEGNSDITIQRKFPENILFPFLGKKAGKADAALTHVYLEDLLITQDHVYLLFEHVVDQNVRKKGSEYYELLTDYGTLILWSFDHEGNAEGFVEVAKHQRSWNDHGYFSSFHDVVVDPTTWTLIYNEIAAEDKGFKTTVPFTATKFMWLDHLEADIQTLSLPKGQLLSPHLIHHTGEMTYDLLLTDYDRKTLQPARLSVE